MRIIILQNVVGCHSPVCATNMHTYRNKCTALEAGFERFEIAPGACSRDASNFSCVFEAEKLIL